MRTNASVPVGAVDRIELTMYASPEDARSDLLLASAVFVFGPLVIRLLLRTLPLNRITVVAVVLAVATPAAVTALVPFLLVRYRGGSWQPFGFTGPILPGLATGALLGLPIAAAGVVGVLTLGFPASAAMPLLGVGPAWLLGAVVRVVTWVGLSILVVFVTVKARDAFPPDYRTLPQGMVEIGRVVLAVAGAAGLVLLVVQGRWLFLLLPVGVAATGYLVYRRLGGPSSASRATLLAPTILMAVGSFVLAPAQLLESFWAAALSGGVGLTMAVLREHRGSAWAVLGLGLVIALATPLPLPLRLGL